MIKNTERNEKVRSEGYICVGHTLIDHLERTLDLCQYVWSAILGTIQPINFWDTLRKPATRKPPLLATIGKAITVTFPLQALPFSQSPGFMRERKRLDFPEEEARASRLQIRSAKGESL
jgi:hypothetical protein